MIYRTFCCLVALLLVGTDVQAQNHTNKKDHIDWRFSSVKQSGSEWKLVFTAVIDRGWHLYSQLSPDSGPMPVSFRFEDDGFYRLLGKVKEMGVLRKGYDDVLMTNVSWYEGTVIFSQIVRVRSKGVVMGEIGYAVCSEEMCIPGSVRFSFDVGN